MTSEVERRLQQAFTALADLVEVPAGQSKEQIRTVTGPRRDEATRRDSWARWRAPLVAAVALGVVVVGTVLAIGHSGSPVAAPPAATVTPGTSSALTSTPGVVTGPTPVQTGPASAPGIGVAYPYELYTHCGIDELVFGGVWLKADTPLGDAAHNAPPGWGNPFQRGTMTLLSLSEAVFRDNLGHDVRFHVVAGAAPKPCD
jgi:hypothetical protein